MTVVVGVPGKTGGFVEQLGNRKCRKVDQREICS